MYTALILIIIGLVIAVNVLLTTLIVTKWKIHAAGLMHDITETREEVHQIARELSKAFSSINASVAEAESTNNQQKPSEKTKMQNKAQPIGFRIVSQINK